MHRKMVAWLLVFSSVAALAACGSGSTAPATRSGGSCSIAVEDAVCAGPGVIPNGALVEVDLPCPGVALLRVPSPDSFAITDAFLETYEVVGGTLQEACSHIFSTSGPQVQGVRYAGKAALDFGGCWNVTGADANGDLKVHITGVDYCVTVTLPTWDAPPGTSPADLAAWNDFVAELEKHEQGHVDRYNAHMQTVTTAVT